MKDQNTYNLKLIQAGYTLPYFIHPNAVSPTEDGEWNYDTLQEWYTLTERGKRVVKAMIEFENAFKGE